MQGYEGRLPIHSRNNAKGVVATSGFGSVNNEARLFVETSKRALDVWPPQPMTQKYSWRPPATVSRDAYK